jgi:dephospho-CoA kinase
VIVVALTGSIGMGKSVAANDLRRLGAVVHDADKVVGRLIGRGGKAVPIIDKAFPGVVKDGAVARDLLGAKVFGNPTALKRLEAILHPMVRADEARALGIARRQRRKVVVLDIPLFYETPDPDRVDAVIVMTAPTFLQRARVLRRPGMTAERLAAVLARQMPDLEKRRRADFVVPTGLGHAFSFRQLSAIMRKLRRDGLRG